MDALVLVLPKICNYYNTLNNHSGANSMCQLGSGEENEWTKMSSTEHNDSQRPPIVDEFLQRHDDMKYFVDLYTAALHLRQRMKEENLIHNTYSACFNDENNNSHSYSSFHTCFHSYQVLNWLIEKQLCKTMDDGKEIFQVLVKMKIIHHVFDLNEFEYPTSTPSLQNVKYLYRFRLDDGTGDQNPTFEQFSAVYETYTSLFTLDKNQCRGVDLQTNSKPSNRYDEPTGVPLKGDNLARMLALRSRGNMCCVERIADEMMVYGLVRFDSCEQSTECNCSGKFRNDNQHQYILSNSYRLMPKQRLDLIALMETDQSEACHSLLISSIPRGKMRTSSSNSSIMTNRTTRTNSNSDEIDCTLKITCQFDGMRRKKSASLNSPANSESRPTAEELERRELPWCWRSYSLKRDRRGYGLILQGQGPCYVERLDPYGSAFNSGIRVNEYIYAVEGINVLRRSGKEVERLLSMFDKCTVYTIYNRDEFCQTLTPPNGLSGNNEFYPIKQFSSSLTDYSLNKKSLLTTVVCQSLCQVNQTINSYSSSPSSSVDGSSSCSISPKHLQQYSNLRAGPFTRHLQLFRSTTRSCSNTLK